MQKCFSLLVLMTLSFPAFGTMKTQCSGPESNGLPLKMLIYTADLKTDGLIPNYPNAEYYIEIESNAKNSAYAIIQGHILTGHYIAGTDLGTFKNGQVHTNPDKTQSWSGSLNGVRFKFEKCDVLLLEPAQH